MNGMNPNGIPFNADTFNALCAEFNRVFGSCNIYGGIFANGWEGPVYYWMERATKVLVEFGDGFGTSEAGDSRVCAALEKAGAVKHSAVNWW